MSQQSAISLKNLKAPVTDTNSLTTREKVVLLNGSKLHGCKFIPWDKDPVATEFEGSLFEDGTDFHFSEEQLLAFDGWARAIEPVAASSDDRPSPVLDLVQDVATDCSVVASLCAETARAERLGSQTRSITCSSIYPVAGQSKNGKYICKLNFNGCFRRVEIDDRIPASKTERSLHVIDRGQSGVIWPALVEKAYLKVTGGYDFPGSNSGTDLWALTGWIPEQTYLQSEEIVPSSFWRRLYNAFKYGDVLVTLGTGALRHEEEAHFGLVRAHAYAVVDMKEDGSRRLLRVKNPWSEGGVWTGWQDLSNELNIESTKHTQESTRPGTFWMDLGGVLQHFETIYLNWNPGLFTHRRDVHFSWDLSQRSSKHSFARNPQYLLRSKEAGTVWLLLSKHYQSFSREYITTGGPDPRLQKGFLCLYAFQRQQRIELMRGSLLRAQYVDAPNVLLRFEMQANASYIIVTSEQDMPSSKLNFTLSAFTTTPVAEFRIADEKYPYAFTQKGEWTRDSAGGNSSSPRFDTNPQFKLVLPKACDLSIVAEAEDPQLNVQVKLVWADGRRVAQPLAKRDVYGDSGEYQRGCCLAELPQVLAGTYTIVCSTFEPDQLGAFFLKVRTTVATCGLSAINARWPVRFTTELPQAILPRSVDRILIPVYVSRLTRLNGLVKSMASTAALSQSPSPSPLRLSLEFGQGPNKFALASSGEFADAIRASVVTADVDVKPAMCAWGSPGLWLVVERMGGASSYPEEVYVALFSEEQGISFGEWGQEVDESIEQFRERLKPSDRS